MPAHSHDELIRQATEFRATLAKRKKQLASDHWQWYPYDTLANFTHFQQLLPNQTLHSLIGEFPIADIGCGDGDLALFLAEQGYVIDALDNPITHHNGMLGPRALIQNTTHDIAIHDVDLDDQWSMPRQQYGLTFLLGVLYHLKNPIAVLEKIAKHSRFLILSTRIARHFPGVSQPLHETPTAYLVGQNELNRDDSNYWIFTQAGLVRVLERSHFRVTSLITTGDTRASNPIDKRHDERAFVLAESRFSLANAELIHGWHATEGAGWRWTQRQFTAQLHTSGRKPKKLLIKGFLPHTVFDQGPITVTLSANGIPLGTEKLRDEGDYLIAKRFPWNFPSADTIEITGAVQPYIARSAEGRELGIIVSAIDLEF